MITFAKTESGWRVKGHGRELYWPGDKEEISDLLRSSEQKIFMDAKEAYAFFYGHGIAMQEPFHDLRYADALLDEYAKSRDMANMLGRVGEDAEAVREKELAYHKVMLLLHGKQLAKLQEECLEDCYTMECRLVPFTCLIERTGVRLDTRLYKETFHYVEGKIKALQALHKQQPLGKINLNISRKLRKLYSSFLLPWLEQIEKGRLKSKYHALPIGGHGTVSGRFACTEPCLQQVPKTVFLWGKDAFLEGPSLRRFFIPEQGCVWGSADYAQVEYRVLAHYAVFCGGSAGRALQDAYHTKPDLDMHELMANRTGLSRTDAKKVGFSLLYGMGISAFCETYGMKQEDAEKLFAVFHKEAPYIKAIMKHVDDSLEAYGCVRSSSGRKHRLCEDRKKFSFFNRLLQGTAADYFKKSLLACWDAGIFSVLTPHALVHDEIDVSVPRNTTGKEAFMELKAIFERAPGCLVPLVMQANKGKNWGSV